MTILHSSRHLEQDKENVIKLVAWVLYDSIAASLDSFSNCYCVLNASNQLKMGSLIMIRNFSEYLTLKCVILTNNYTFFQHTETIPETN